MQEQRAMGGKIDCYVDCASLYSYFAITHLRRNRERLGKWGVDVEFIPIFLGGVNAATGNVPPSTLPARGQYLKYDTARGAKYFGTPPLKSPDFFPLLSILPQRCMLYIKDHYPNEKFETAYVSLWHQMNVLNINISQPPQLIACLSEHFLADEVSKIMAAGSDPKYKEMLTANTKRVIELGAYGAPWHWVTNAEGKGEPFFGSDRYQYMWEFLGVPHSKVEILDPAEAKGTAKL